MPRDAQGKNRKWKKFKTTGHFEDNYNLREKCIEQECEIWDLKFDNNEEEEDQLEEIKETVKKADLNGSIDELSDQEEEVKRKKKKGVEGLIEIQNPNRMKIAANEIQISRREKEEHKKIGDQKHYQKMQKEGKPTQAKADLERLAEISKKRELAAIQKEEEKQKQEELKK